MNKIDLLVSKAHEHWRCGNELDMCKYLDEAIKICRIDNNISKLIEILNEYGGCLRVIGKYDKALKVLEESELLYRDYFSTSSEGYANILMNIGNAYREKKDFFTSEIFFKKSKDIFENCNIKNYSYVGLLNNYSLLCQSIGNNEYAEKLQLEAISILEKDDKYKIPLAISYNNLYEIHKNSNRCDISIEYLIKAEKILSDEVGNKHPLYAAILNNLADNEYKNGHYEISKQLYKKSLDIIYVNYGDESEAYKTVKENLNFLEDFTKTITKKKIIDKKNIQTSPTDFNRRESGLEKSEKLSNKLISFISKNHPSLYERICIALVGKGSECLGFDDLYSEDHDFEERCQIFLNKSDYLKWHQDLEKVLLENFKEKIEIISIDSFYRYYTLYSNGPSSLEEFMRVPEDLLCTACNGKVFIDNLGEFSKIRKRLLNFYPEDIRYKKMAYYLNKMAQSGQYNFSRMIKRNDFVTANIALYEFIQYYMKFIHLINKKYSPFYKWIFKSTCSLEVFGEYTKTVLPKLINSDNDEKEVLIGEICNKIVSYLQEVNLSESNIDFLTYQAEEVMKNISDDKIRREDSWTK